MAKKIIVIDGYIGPFGYSKQFIRQQLDDAKTGPVEIQSSSLGGSVDHALAIHDMLSQHGDVCFNYTGFNASSATFLSLGSKKIKISENSFYLIHKPMSWIDEFGTLNDDGIEDLIARLENEKDNLSKVTLQLAKMYAGKSGKTIKEILDLMKKESWLTAAEALDWGFVDEVYIPKNVVNYLEDVKMVALITSNGMPAPQRKSGSLETPVKHSDEENLFERIWNRVTNKQNQNNLSNNKKMKKQYLNINKVLNVETLESQEEGIYLVEGQLESIDTRLATADTGLKAANSERDTANQERDVARTELSNTIIAFETLDASVKEAKTPEEKVNAIRTLLAAKPGVQGQGILDEKDKDLDTKDEVDWEAINNSELGKMANQI